jgi:hypothetical protein
MNEPSTIQKLMSRIGFDLEANQGDMFWTECVGQLQTHTSENIIANIKNDTSQSLDTLEREVLMDCIGIILTGMSWPINGDSQPVRAEFFSKLAASCKARGYKEKDA